MSDLESMFTFDKDTTALFRNVSIVLIVSIFLGVIFLQRRGIKDKDSELPSLYQPRILFTIGGILGTSLVMAIFEVIFARTILLPKTHSSIINNARQTGIALQLGDEDLATDSSLLGIPTVGLTSNLDEAVMYSLSQVEEKKVKKINSLVFSSVIIPVSILLFLISGIVRRIRESSQKYGVDGISSVHLLSLLYGIIFSVVVFGSFQIIFYQFSLGYKASSIQEIQVDMTDRIREDLNCGSSINLLPIPPINGGNPGLTGPPT